MDTSATFLWMSDATLNDDGHAKLDVDGLDGAEVVNISTRERVARMKNVGDTSEANADTIAELVQRRLDTVDLIVQGASLRQIAERHDVDYFTARHDYYEGMAMLNDRTADAVNAMRDEVTMRQREIIFANMPLARRGDADAAKIVMQADNMLAGLWGLRSARLEVTPAPASDLRSALNDYMQAVAEVHAG